MSVYCDKVFGYIVDVSEEFDKLNRDLADKWIDYDKEYKDLYDKLGFVTYYGYGQKAISNGNITLIYDGMSGEYCKLVLIDEYVYKSDCEEQDDDIVTSINRELSKVEIDNSIKEKLQLAYENIFNSDENIMDRIKLEYLIHWH